MQPRLRRELRRLVEADVPAAYRGGVAIVLPVPPEDAKAFALEDGLAPEELHCTLAYLGDASELPEETLDAVRQAVEAWSARAPFTAKVGGIGRFAGAPGEDDVVYLPVDAPRLPAERAELLQALADAGAPASADHGFNAHVTLSYIEPEDDLPTHRVEPRAVRFSSVELWIGDDHIPYDLTAQPTTETRMHARTIRSLMEIIAAPVPRFEAGEAPGGSAGGGPEHQGMKMVFGVWRKVGDMDHHDHTTTGTKHAELHDKHLKKALHHATAMYAAQKAGKHDEASTHATAAKHHHAVSIVHKDLARRHWKEGENGEKDPQPVPEPNQATMRAAHKQAQNVDTLHHHNHPEAFLTHTGAHRTAQRTGIPMT